MKQSLARSLVGLALRILLVVVLSAVFGSQLMAQTFYGSILGTVTDASGAIISGTAVNLTNIATSEQRTTTTDSNGNYEFLSLAPGSYRLDTAKAGFKHFTREPITVEIQSSVRIDVQLPAGNVTETVTVTAPSPLIDTVTSSLSQMVEGRAVQASTRRHCSMHLCGIV
jgi:Carboxypeptidase regulatory-like domain